jgi:geranylgeranyl diphosphate synthase type I
MKSDRGTIMTGEENRGYTNIGLLMKERAKRVLERFGEIAVLGITDPALISIVEDVKKYWKDNFRPAFTSLCCEAVGGQPEAADNISLMITLASAGGGIHDDLIDKSRNKHFRMTILGLHGPDYALLVGDLFILKGWMMAKDVITQTCPREKLVNIIEVFSKWTIEVCEAEFREISCRKNLSTEVEDYEEILRKSMADVEACAKLGAIIGSGSQLEVESLGNFGGCIGFLYRILNDVNDTFNKEFDLQNRLNFESVPLPILYAAKHGKKNQIKSIINKSSIKNEDSLKLKKICVNTGAFDYIQQRAIEEKRKASKMLEPLSASEAQNTLKLIINQRLSEICQSIKDNL